MHIGVIKKEFFAGFTSGFVLAALLLALHPAGVLRPRGCPLPETGALGAARLQVEHRRRLAQVVSEVSRQVARWPDAPDGKWARRLSEVAAELDPRLPRAPSLLVFPAAASSSSSSPPSSSSTSSPTSPSSSSSSSSSSFSSSSSSSSSSPLQWDFSARLPDAPLPNRSRSVCPEVYLGGRYGWPFFQHGMEAEKECKEAPPLYDVLTVLLPARRWPERRLRRVREAIAKEHRVRVIVIAEGEVTVKDAADVRVIKLSGRSESDALNDAVELVETPFVFLGESLAHFSNQSSLERLVRVLDDLDHVQVAGGAARDTRGRWIHGCLQQHMANYHAKYTLGYYHSKYECMYCDDLLTPFATRTKLLRTIPFTAGLSGQAVYRDWFAKVRSAGHLAVTCPDVMFFLSDHVNMTAEDWLPMAKRWTLEKVQSFDGKEHVFSCESVGISCKNPLKTIHSYLLPPCCVAEMEEQIGYLVSFAEERHLEHELHVGSALGAVKMGRYLPWDYDTDIVVDCKQFGEWMKINTYLKTKRTKCKMKVTKKGYYITIYCPHFFLEVICHKGISNSRVHLPDEYRNVPTQALYAGHWTNIRSNPGLYCRNSMGLEVLRHAAHWRTLKSSEDAKARGGYSSPGTWNKCKNQRHHSCLDRYPGDGNLPFTQPFLRP